MDQQCQYRKSGHHVGKGIKFVVLFRRSYIGQKTVLKSKLLLN